MMTEAQLRPWLVALAQELSGLDDLPEAVPFEELGLDSFAVLSLATEIGVRLGVTLSPEELGIHRTIAGLARLLAERAPGGERSVVTVRQGGGPEGAAGPVLVLVHTATGDANFFAQALRHVPADQAIVALHWRPPASAPPLESLEAHAACFLPLMRIAIPHGGSPRAPWCLLGYSAGARLAFVPDPGEDPAALGKRLAARAAASLPGPLRPVAWKPRESLPRLPGGKIDLLSLQ